MLDSNYRKGETHVGDMQALKQSVDWRSVLKICIVGLFCMILSVKILPPNSDPVAHCYDPASSAYKVCVLSCKNDFDKLAFLYKKVRGLCHVRRALR